MSSSINKAYASSNQSKLAELAGISQPTVGRYLASSDAVKAMSLATFFSLFPNAAVIFAKSRDVQLAEELHAFIDELSDQDKEKALAILSAAFA